MRELTKRKIEKRAVFEIVNFIEEQIDRIILQSLKEFDNLNKARESQNIHKKVVLDAHCVKQAIKNIYSNNYYILPKRAGGDKREEGNEEDKHSQFLKEVYHG